MRPFVFERPSKVDQIVGERHLTLRFPVLSPPRHCAYQTQNLMVKYSATFLSLSSKPKPKSPGRYTFPTPQGGAMKLKKALPILFLVCTIFICPSLVCPSLFAQPARRIAILPANDKFAEIENHVADDLTGKLAGKNGVTIIDRAITERILKEQNFQNSDRSSLDTAARIGKLVGAGQIVLVQVASASYTGHQETSGDTTKNIGTVVLQADARVIDVETAVILGQPASSFQDSAVVNETVTKKGSNGIHFGAIQTRPTPPTRTTTGSDPKVVENNEWTKAIDAVSADLTSQLIKVFSSAPGPKAEFPLVAGIANGSVFINEGTTAGIKQGDRFQIVRKVDVGLKDPKTGQPITQRRRICVLMLANVDETNSSGACQGGLPMSGDVAEPLQP
jgi:hypothetical protein